MVFDGAPSLRDALAARPPHFALARLTATRAGEPLENGKNKCIMLDDTLKSNNGNRKHHPWGRNGKLEVVNNNWSKKLKTLAITYNEIIDKYYIYYNSPNADLLARLDRVPDWIALHCVDEI